MTLKNKDIINLLILAIVLVITTSLLSCNRDNDKVESKEIKHKPTVLTQKSLKSEKERKFEEELLAQLNETSVDHSEPELNIPNMTEHNNDYFDSSFYNRMASLKYFKGDYKGAVQDWTKVIEHDPNSSAIYYFRGNAKAKLGDYTGALQDYNKAIELNKAHHVEGVGDYFERGNAKFELGDYRGAIQDYNKAIEIDTDNIISYISYYNRGIAKINLGQINNGCFDLSKAGELGYNEAYDAIKQFCQ